VCGAKPWFLSKEKGLSAVLSIWLQVQCQGLVVQLGVKEQGNSNPDLGEANLSD
jgi:hypothetical protein